MNQIEIEMILLTGVAALIFAFVHVFIGKLTFLNVIPRSRWLSFSGGVAVAYVFLHILPELNKHGETFAHELNTRTYMAELWVFLVTLVGLVFFYGLERTVKVSRQADDEDKVDSWMLWLHTGSHGLYNLLIGYLLLHREESGLGNLVTYTFAMTLHFATSDFGMRQDQKNQYDAVSGWILAVTVLAGWVIGIFANFPEIVTGFLFALLAGGIVLNVLKEELPEERKSRFWPFAMGAGLYAALLLFIAE